MLFLSGFWRVNHEHERTVDGERRMGVLWKRSEFWATTAKINLSRRAGSRKTPQSARAKCVHCPFSAIFAMSQWLFPNNCGT